MKTNFFRPLSILPLLCALATPSALQAQFDFVTNNGTITISRYTGPGGDVVIPDTIFGLPVTTIGTNAFDSCSSLSSVMIPDSITSIGNRAFYSCTGLTNVAIPNSVTNIGRYAFDYCSSLTSIFLGANVTTLGYLPFSWCYRLSNITVDPANAHYSSVDGVLFNKSRTTLVQHPEGKPGSHYTIPNGVTSIGEEAFFLCTNLTGVTIPDSVTNIGLQAFTLCGGLTSVTIPDRVTDIGNYAFVFCDGLASVTIGNGLTSLGYWTFSYCPSLTEVHFRGNAPTSVSPDAFYGTYNAIVYYLPGTTGWSSTLAGRPTAPWWLPAPLILSCSPSYGIPTKRFGFRISWATNASVAVETCTSLATPVWSPVRTNTLTMGIDPLTDGWSDFTDPQWTNYPTRFYRVRSR